jgi:ribosomal protein S18 acetylase RimI-like enzyme
LKQYRGQGLAAKIFNHSIPFLKKENINHYLLEVLQHNTKAVSVYQKINFITTREFYYFVWKNDEFNNEIENINVSFKIKTIGFEGYKMFSDFWDFTPSWQNSFESIQRVREDFVILGAFEDKKLIGYCILEPNSGDIPQIAVDKAYRRKGVASLLIHEASNQNKCLTTKIVNTDISCNSIVEFLKAKNVNATGKQFEMMKEL